MHSNQSIRPNTARSFQHAIKDTGRRHKLKCSSHPRARPHPSPASRGPCCRQPRLHPRQGTAASPASRQRCWAHRHGGRRPCWPASSPRSGPQPRLRRLRRPGRRRLLRPSSRRPRRWGRASSMLSTRDTRRLGTMAVATRALCTMTGRALGQWHALCVQLAEMDGARLTP